MKLESRHWVVGSVLLSLLIVVGSYFSSRWIYRITPQERVEIHQGQQNRSDSVYLSDSVKPVDRVKDTNADAEKESSDGVLSSTTQVGTLDESWDNEADLNDAFPFSGSQSTQQDEYPSVPKGFPIPVLWELPPQRSAHLSPQRKAQHILTSKVLIELWNRGDHDFINGYISDQTGKVYPLYPNTVYVRWGDFVDDDGVNRRYISGITGVGDVNLTHEQMRNGEIPSGVRVIDHDTGGFYPHEILSEQ